MVKDSRNIDQINQADMVQNGIETRELCRKQNKKIKVYVAADKFRLDTRGNEYYQSKDDNKKT